MSSRMRQEIQSIPETVARQLEAGGGLYRDIGRRLRGAEIRSAISNARGTSDHAANYLKYLMELQIGVPVASVGPSIASVYGRRLRLDGQLCVTISQSGASTDLVMLQKAAADGGAMTLALVNDTASPVATGASVLAPIHAGPELSVAATKTFVACQVAAAAIVAEWAGDGDMARAVEALPSNLSRSVAQDWSAAIPAFLTAPSAFTVARGPGLAVAAEAALKLKETCRLHAEAVSAAELRHGPIALARKGFAALVFSSRDDGRASIGEAAAALRRAGASVHLCGSDEDPLPSVQAGHPLLDPICQVTSFYVFVEQLARARGNDPDRPVSLSKVTITQ